METSEEGPQPGGLGLYKGVPSPLLGHPFQTGLQLFSGIRHFWFISSISALKNLSGQVFYIPVSKFSILEMVKVLGLPTKVTYTESETPQGTKLGLKGSALKGQGSSYRPAPEPKGYDTII